MLVVEIDGQSHGMGDRPAHDLRRETFLIEQGLRVLRYPAELVMRDPNGVAQAVFDAARRMDESSSSPPSVAKRGGGGGG